MKKAFTMIELVLVIIIVGIISATIVPQIGKTSLDRCAQQVLHHIRYTQHLAMMDNKFDPNDQYWYRSRWQIKFQKNSGEIVYTIFNDKNSTHGYNGNASTVLIKNEIAKNPLNPKQLLTGLSASSKINTKEMNLKRKYNINQISFSQSCSVCVAGHCSKNLIFDQIGRPLYGKSNSLNHPYRINNGIRLVENKCTITLTDTDNNSRKIVIMPETGYSYIED